MAKVKVLKERKTDGTYEKVYPITSENAVLDENGKSIKTKLSQVEQNLGELDDNKLEVDSVKDNGNIVLKDGDGNTKEYMAATPSGDPMHYAYVEAGAEYNATGADITKTAPWGDSVTHKAGYWYLNGLGDITNNQIRAIYTHTSGLISSAFNFNYLGWQDSFIRTNFKPIGVSQTSNIAFNVCSELEVVDLCTRGSYSRNIDSDTGFNTSAIRNLSLNIITSAYYMCNNLKHIIGIFNITGSTTGVKYQANKLETFIIKGINVSTEALSLLPKLSNKSIAILVKRASTATITIKLHADAYARAMADADVQAALASKTNVTLVSA